MDDAGNRGAEGDDIEVPSIVVTDHGQETKSNKTEVSSEDKAAENKPVQEGRREQPPQLPTTLEARRNLLLQRSPEEVPDAMNWFDDMGGTATRDKGKGKAVDRPAQDANTGVPAAGTDSDRTLVDAAARDMGSGAAGELNDDDAQLIVATGLTSNLPLASTSASAALEPENPGLDPLLPPAGPSKGEPASHNPCLSPTFEANESPGNGHCLVPPDNTRASDPPASHCSSSGSSELWYGDLNSPLPGEPGAGRAEGSTTRRAAKRASLMDLGRRMLHRKDKST
jgi:hypothetical protein